MEWSSQKLLDMLVMFVLMQTHDGYAVTNAIFLPSLAVESLQPRDTAGAVPRAGCVKSHVLIWM